MKKSITYTLVILLLMSIMLPTATSMAASTEVYMDAISGVMDTLRKNDSSASNINHQILNGRYRTVQMLEIIAYMLDTSGAYADHIDGVMDTFVENDSSASNINHQMLNGAYRTVQMLEIIAYELDATDLLPKKVVHLR